MKLDIVEITLRTGRVRVVTVRMMLYKKHAGRVMEVRKQSL